MLAVNVHDIVGVLRDSILVVLGVAVAALLARSGARAWTRELTATRRTIAAFRWWMPVGSVVTTAGVLGVVALVEQVPGFSWGWYRLIAGIDGNVLIGQSDGRLSASQILSVMIPVVLLPAVPHEARIEEEVFRAGNHGRSLPARVNRAIAFGLIHCVVGVPLSVGIALIVAGVYYDLVYEGTVRSGYRSAREAIHHPPAGEKSRECAALDEAEASAVDAATAAHSVSNAMIVTGLIVSWFFR